MSLLSWPSPKWRSLPSSPTPNWTMSFKSFAPLRTSLVSRVILGTTTWHPLMRSGTSSRGHHSACPTRESQVTSHESQGSSSRVTGHTHTHVTKDHLVCAPLCLSSQARASCRTLMPGSLGRIHGCTDVVRPMCSHACGLRALLRMRLSYQTWRASPRLPYRTVPYGSRTVMSGSLCRMDALRS